MTPRTETVGVRVGELEVLIWDAESPAHGDQAAPTVVALHGFPESAWEWRSVAEILAAAGIRVVAPMQRGYSPGARPTAVEDYSIERLTEDVLTVVEHFGLGPVHLLGHDWGASVAWWIAGHHPHRLASMVAVSVPHLEAFADALAADPDQQERSAYFALFRQAGKAEDVLLEDGAQRLKAMFGGDVPEDLMAAHLEMIGNREGLTGALNWYRAMRRYAVPDVTVPTTLIWGEQDLAISRSGAEATADRMAADYRFVPVAGEGHWLPETRPDLIATEVLGRIR